MPSLYAQEAYSSCDKVLEFQEVDSLPKYNTGDTGLLKYILNDIAVTLTNCIRRDSMIPASMRFFLTIDKNGQVVDVDFLKIDATDQCKQALKQQFITTMPKWIPAIRAGAAVCCRRPVAINCLKWNF